MRLLRGLLPLAFAVWIAFGSAPGYSDTQEQQSRTLRSGTDLVVIDVQVVTGKGHPMVGLQPADFEVQIGGSSRRVLHVEFLQYSQPVVDVNRGTDPRPVSAPAAPDQPPRPRRLYILAVDESSFSTLSVLAWKEAIKRFIEKLAPEDFAGLYAYPMGGSLVQLTQDHAAVLAGADKIVGRLDPPMLRYQMSLSEMADITRGERDVARRVAERECARSEIARSCGPCST